MTEVQTITVCCFRCGRIGDYEWSSVKKGVKAYSTCLCGFRVLQGECIEVSNNSGDKSID